MTRTREDGSGQRAGDWGLDMKANRAVLTAVAVAAVTCALTACQPSGAAGAGGNGVSCDPNGWGPLSECGTTPNPTTTPAEVTSAPASPAPTETTVPTAEPPSWAHQWPDYDEITRTPANSYTVTITWIVVSIRVTGFQECVLELRSAEPDSHDPVSRRFTTPADCDAQRVDTVYRPIGR